MKKGKNKKIVQNVVVGTATVVAGAVAYGLIFEGNALYIYDKIVGTASGTPTPKVIPSGDTPSQAIQSGFPIKRGSKGSEVRTLQNALIEEYGRGVLPRFGADGDFGAETESALISKGLPVVYATKADLDKVVGELTVSPFNTTTTPQSTSTKAFSFPTLYSDSKKYDAVLAIQKELNKRGIADFEGKKLTEDGIIGRRTGSAMGKAGFKTTPNVFIGINVALIPISEQDYNLFMSKFYPFSGLGNVNQISTRRGTAILNIDGTYQNYAPEGQILGRVVSNVPNSRFYTFISNEGDAGLVLKNDVM